MPRPKKIADDDLLDRVGRLLMHDGPEALTFASAGKAAGLAPASLVQRYGNRDALLQAALLRMWDRLDAATEAADAHHTVTPNGAVRLLLALSDGYDDDAAQNLLLLREDFRDPALRARGVAWHRTLVAALGRRLGTGAQKQVLGRLLANSWQGAIVWWGFSRKRSLREHLRRELRDWLRAMPGDN